MKNNWEVKKLGEICEIATGKWDANHAVDEGEFRFYTCARDYFYCDTKRFTGECLILPGNGVNVGDVYFYDGEFDAYQRTYVMHRINQFPKYIYYHLLLYWRIRNFTKQYGSATNFIKIGNFTDYEIPIPPLPEQQRIVGILDKAFAAIGRAKENAEKNLQNARDLFDSYLQSIFANPGNDWEEREFEDCLDKIIYTNKIQRKAFLESGEFPIVSQEQDFINGYWNDADDLFKVKKPVVIFGDHTQVLKYVDFDFVLGADGVKILQPINELNPKYFFYFLKNTKFKTLGYARHYRLLKELSIMIPSVSEQKTIVFKLELLSAETKKLENIYRQKLNDLDELKKSILQKAFNGELSQI